MKNVNQMNKPLNESKQPMRELSNIEVDTVSGGALPAAWAIGALIAGSFATGAGAGWAVGNIRWGN